MAWMQLFIQLLSPSKRGAKKETINFQGTVNLVEAAKEQGVRRFINISQMGAAANLPYRFLASKGKAREYVAQSGLDWTAFRPSVIWGPEDEFANTFARLIPLSPLVYPIIGDENTRFQPVWVDDVASCVLAALDDAKTFGKEYELGGQEVFTLEEIERSSLLAVGAERIMIRFPMPLLKMIVSIMEAILPVPPVTRSLLELLAIENVAKSNVLMKFVPAPRAFTAENALTYMRMFRVGDTLNQFFVK